MKLPCRLLGCGTLFPVFPILAISLTLMTFPARAQQVNPSLPGAIINGQTNPYNQRQDSIRQVPSVSSPKSGTPVIQDQTKLAPKSPVSTEKIHINRIDIQGVTKLSRQEIQSVIAPYQNQDLTLETIQEKVADPLTALYEKKGYVTSLVFIPPQTVSGGVLILKADEGVVNNVVYKEGHYFKYYAVVPRLDVKSGEVFQLADLQRSLRRINDNPDINLQATLKAGANPGQTDITIEPRYQNHVWHLTPFVDNLGRPFIGNTRYGATLQDNNVLGFGDTLYSNHAFTTHSYSMVNGYEIPLGSHGTKLGFSQAYNTFGFRQNGVKVNGNAGVYTPYIAQEFYRSERFVASGDIGFGIKNDSFTANGFKNSIDHLRVITPGFTIQQFDRTGRTLIRNEVGIGLDILNATTGSALRTPTSSRLGAGSQFWRYTGSVLRTQRLPLDTYGVFKWLYQYSPDSLTALEQFQAGGAFTVRGYSEGRIIGDSGTVLSAEWRVPTFFFSKTAVIPHTQYRLRDNIQMIAFADGGAVFDHKAPFPGVNTQSVQRNANAYLLGVGVGLRARLTRLLTARADIGFPLINLTPGIQSCRLHFGVESELF